MMQNQKERYEELIKLIEYHNNKYYNEDKEEISNYEFDKLTSELRELEKNMETIPDNSPSQKVGGTTKREAGVNVTHNVPMLSIQDVFEISDVCAWIKKVKTIYPDAKFNVEHKIDGLSETSRYHKNLELAETRGDGFIGEDVTSNVLEIKDVVKSISLSDYLEVRSEVYMSFEDFEKTNLKQEELGKKTFENPRNCAAGTLRQLDSTIVKERGLSIFAFNVQAGPEEFMQSHSVALSKLKELGFTVVPSIVCDTEDEVITAIHNIADIRGSFSYGIDGAVVKIDQIAYRDAFPAGSKYGAGHIAYKYPPEEKKTILRDIELTVGRTGRVTPTAIFDTIRLCNTAVSRATLHNQDYINELGIGIGDTLIVYKSGEIIPKVKGVVKEKRPVGVTTYVYPDRCPVCNEPIYREKGEADFKCVNPMCASQLERTIVNFVGRNAMDIKGFGEKYIQKLIELEYILNYSDIYKLKKYKEKLIELGIMGKEKNTEKILEAIEKSKLNSPIQLLIGLGVPDVGVSSAKELMKHFDSIMGLAKATLEELVAIPDIGEITANKILRFFENKQNVAILNSLYTENINMNMPIVKSGEKFAGQTFVITGTLPTHSRSEIEKLIEENGGKCSGSVSKKTNYVIAGENAGTKLDKAKDLGIKVLSETEFLKMI